MRGCGGSVTLFRREKTVSTEAWHQKAHEGTKHDTHV